MDWRLNSSRAVTAGELRAHLEAEAAAFIRETCPPVAMSGGLSAPQFVESEASAKLRSEMTTAIDALCALAAAIDSANPGARFLCSFSDVLTVDGGRRINLSIDEAMPAYPAGPTDLVFSDDPTATYRKPAAYLST